MALKAVELRESGHLPDEDVQREAFTDDIEKRAPNAYAKERLAFYRKLAKDASMQQQLSVYRTLLGALHLSSQIRRARASIRAKAQKVKRAPGRPRKGTEAPLWQRMPRPAIFEPIGPGGSYKETSRQHRPRDAWQEVVVSDLFAYLRPVYGSQGKTLVLMANLFCWVFNLRHGEDWMKRAFKRVIRS